MSGETWAIFDTETTGLIANDLRPLDRQPRIIELAGVLIRREADGTWTETGCIDTLVDPERRIDDIITKVTGIKPQDLIGKPKWKDIAAEVEAFFAKADGYACHNAAFDRRQIAMEMARIGRVMLWPEKAVCTVEIGECLYGKMIKLSDMHADLFGAPHANAHRALDDVRATARCFAELYNRGEIAPL